MTNFKLTIRLFRFHSILLWTWCNTRWNIFNFKVTVNNVIKDVDFLLWTKHNPFEETILNYDDSLPDSLSNSHFDETLPTKIIVHGYDGSGRQDWVINTKDAYLMIGDNYNLYLELCQAILG